MSISLNYIPARNIQHAIAKNNLPLLAAIGYSERTLAKSRVGFRSLKQLLATHDAPCVFFCVYAYAYLLNTVLYRSESMVALAGQPTGWLESSNSSTANPVNVTTPNEFRSSRGDSFDKLLEIIIMMAIPTQTHSKFIFLAVKRSDTAAKPCRIETSAPNERTARLSLVRDYVLLFAGHIPAKAVAHV